MIRLILNGFKFFIVVIVVLVMSQIHIGEKRITDHVHALLQKEFVQAPVRWVSAKFNFTEASKFHDKDGKPVQVDKPTHALSSRHGEETEAKDRGLLSGLLKRTVSKPGSHQ